MSDELYYKRAEVTGVARGIEKNFSPFSPAVLPAIGNIYTNVLFHYIEKKLLEKTRVFATYSDFLIFF